MNRKISSRSDAARGRFARGSPSVGSSRGSSAANLLRAGAIATLLAIGGVGQAPLLAQAPKVEMQVVPTDVEWQQFPPFCQARYSITLYALGTKFQNRVSPGEVNAWQQRMGVAWEGLHHYCYGLVQMSRAPAIADLSQRAFVYERAIDEFAFAYNNTQPHPFRAQMAVQLALAHRGAQNLEQALRFADEALYIDRKLEAAYSAKAVIQRQAKDLEGAVETLRAGLEALAGQSAELHYFLGLTYLDLEQLALAQEHADKAYALGYPLPGLRNRLARRGQPSAAR